MRKLSLLTLLLVSSFFMGYAVKSFQDAQGDKPRTARVTGIGGVFFKSKDPKSLRAWYAENLGLEVNDYGSVFEWFQGADSTKKGFLQWSPIPEGTKFFEPSQRDFMINYRVEGLDVLFQEFKHKGISVLDSIETYQYGKFLHIVDLEGNKVELWEPNDVEYEKLGRMMRAKTTK